MHAYRLAVLSAASLVALFSAAHPANAETNANQLTTEQLQVSQAVSRAVLTAKKSQTVDPELADLSQSVGELRVLVDELTLPVLATAALTPDSAGIAVGKPAPSEPPSHVKARDTLAKIAARRAQAEANLALRPQAQKNTAPHNVATNAAAKLKQLETEIDQALAAEPEARAKLIAALKQRLGTKQPVSLMTAQAEPLRAQPTLSTLARHRASVEPSAAPPAAAAKKK